MKQVFFFQAFSVSKYIGKNIFLLATDKKLLTKDSPTEHFRL
jgi:hypothetical protein